MKRFEKDLKTLFIIIKLRKAHNLLKLKKEFSDFQKLLCIYFTRVKLNARRTIKKNVRQDANQQQKQLLAIGEDKP